MQGTSYNLNGILVSFYLVVYGAIETIFTIKLEQRKSKKQPSNDNPIKDKQSQITFWCNFSEGLLHGGTIAAAVLLTLPNARLAGGKLFPVEAVHFSIYFLVINVSIFRHLISGNCSKLAVIVLAIISYPLLLGGLWLVTLFDHNFSRLAVQMGMIWTCYDSVLMLCNATVFSLACSLFVA